MADVQVTIHYDDTPPSLNTVGSRGGLMQFRNHKVRWQRTFEQLLMASALPRRVAHIDAALTMRFKVRRTRDTGNLLMIVEKALGDALVRGLWLPDDSHEFFTCSLAFDEEPGPNRTTVALTARLP